LSLYDIPYLQYSEEASIDQVWQYFIRRDLVWKNCMIVKKCLSQIMKVV
jgi:hypothetical protein